MLIKYQSILMLLGGSIFLSMLIRIGRLLPVCGLTAPRMSLTFDTLLPALLTLSSFFLMLFDSFRLVELTLGMNSLL